MMKMAASEIEAGRSGTQMAWREIRGWGGENRNDRVRVTIHWMGQMLIEST